MKKIRLDQHLVNLGLADSRGRAQRAIEEGLIKVNGSIASKPSQLVPVDCAVVILAQPEFVSRAGAKLKAALDNFKISPLARVCADVGASTGGFTDCLLQRGARKVFAIDVGQDELHASLRNHPLVIVMDRTNARELQKLPEIPELVTIDVSFISLDFILPAVRQWFGDKPGEVVALVKPQFEAGREEVKKHKGVIRDRAVHAQVLRQVIAHARQIGFTPAGLIPSPITGSDGNTEFLLWLRVGCDGKGFDDDEAVARVIPPEAD
ncbi:MAG: TlyA family RNA methyltransferase [Chloroflexi bacterium]|jgi:23S rRNA (cytidine1920-2'-O)/16S rRNA (cytidine1409-2'-O)-methyltransferase|nr:TlyA family RNA methyltransferase [Anaerolineaceae bacterium]NLI44125.1 TlyA family RNA methyltransferase [Chloroflexota bacterium]HOE34634.1 TlyA family RNA methyltransferase [Anaerolineaceae bacterium]HOT24842.1 TlyA family RNA methyltransferase [Anaerolineaceae bacterium]HQH57611.1 TlyA family RNA methyltransferase [Anaerolineaceae bacterium]